MKLELEIKAEKGIYENITPWKYFALKNAKKDDLEYIIPSKSMLTKFSENPEKWITNPPFIKTASMTEGSLLDCMLLTPQLIETEFIVKPEDAPRRPTQAQINAEKKSDKAKESIEYWEKFDLRSKNKEVITKNQVANAKKALKRIKANKKCNEIVENSSKQAVCIAEYRGFLVKGMFDMIPDENGESGDSIVDLKRTSAFAPRAFSGIIRKFKYHWQAGLYRWLYKEATGKERQKWKFMISDAEDPYGCGLLTMHEDDIKRGEDEVFEALDQYIDCIEKQNFPNPYNREKELTIKSFSDIFND